MNQKEGIKGYVSGLGFVLCFKKLRKKKRFAIQFFLNQIFGSVIRPKSVSFLRIWGWDWRTGTGQKAKTGKH
jgi:hypothetical protein